jgi:hypothetical protein
MGWLLPLARRNDREADRYSADYIAQFVTMGVDGRGPFLS